MTISKQSVEADMSAWVKQQNRQNGYWITLDAPYIDKKMPDVVRFEQALGKFAVRRNNYCYGRAFNAMDRPHAHLVALHDTDMTRGFAEVERKVRDIWFEITGARGNIYSNLVDIQPVGDTESRLHYAVKRFNGQSDKYCRLVTF
jgi:hypothetical protein